MPDFITVWNFPENDDHSSKIHGCGKTSDFAQPYFFYPYRSVAADGEDGEKLKDCSAENKKMPDGVEKFPMDNVKNHTSGVGYPAVKQHLVAAAGGDLFMPGGKRDYDDILKGLRSGALTREQLLVNASRLYRMARELTGTK
jgi:hypothetical protein